MEVQALLSVFNKDGILELAKGLKECGATLISTGGTSKTLSEAGFAVTQVSDVTKFPELLEGRVKTLHPNIHAGILAKGDSSKHLKELEDHHIKPIQLVVVNLYPFEQTISKPGTTLDEAIEMIDIGGVALLRAAAKNFKSVIPIVDPQDYIWIVDTLKSKGLQGISLQQRSKLAVKAFQHVCSYDAAISQYLANVDVDKQTEEKKEVCGPLVVRQYEHSFNLKYGVNPHQVPAAIYSLKGLPLPFKVLNGTPGYINLLDALNSWQLVKELKEATKLPAAASFKHVSPAGPAVAVPLTPEETAVFEVGDRSLTPQALAYVRARQADPMCSYGDFAALSDVVDEQTALFLKTEVSDGIIAPGFEPKALEILKQKKNGQYIVLEANIDFEPPNMEYRELYGVTFAQKRNWAKLTESNFKEIVTTEKSVSENAIRDLIVSTITLKFTQSNSVGYAINGQMIGVGAGQQSRVDCTKLAGNKVKNFHLRFHPKVKNLPFKSGAKRVDKTNARIHFIENDLTSSELELFDHVPQYLTEQEKLDWLTQLTGVSLSSDAFFPFRDSIDVARKLGVKYVAQPGGSIQDESVTKACNEYGMVMVTTGVRLFHH